MLCLFLQLAKDLMHPSFAEERRQHKKKRLVQNPNSYFMDVKCMGRNFGSWCKVLGFIFSYVWQALIDLQMLIRVLQDHHHLQPCPDSGALCRLLYNPLQTDSR